jgi:hypothetical protein
VVVSHHQNAGHSHNLLIADKSLENVVKFNYLGMTVTNHNCINEESKTRLNSENACNQCIQILVFISSL